ncbi:MAG: hypothetical protein K0Q76_3236 [Panacagrimonas sp.]|nr:DUF2834 domain-containing protein [Panacagrimonas sp.]MCC2658128.1 hypothetical protein [Panacagrimonas sp.]
MSSDAQSRTPEYLFWFLALLGAIGTQAQLPAYLPHGLVNGTIEFWKDALINPAGVFLVADIFVLASAVVVWTFGECRRLSMPRAWLYLVASLVIGVSIFVPVFFAMRERKRRTDAGAGTWRLEGSDWIAVGMMLALCVAAVGYSLMNVPPMAA